MSHGGARHGAGRKPGAATRINEETRKKAAEAGVMPLEYMLGVMRDEQQDRDRRDEMAKAAAPYVHARLSSAEVKSETTVRYVARLPRRPRHRTIGRQSMRLW
jgi:hypothetical protein